MVVLVVVEDVKGLDDQDLHVAYLQSLKNTIRTILSYVQKNFSRSNGRVSEDQGWQKIDNWRGG